MLRSTILALSLCVFAMAPVTAQAQSFNCRYAKKADEKLICGDPELGQLDERMVAVFEDLMSRAPRYLARMIRAEQDGWLISRHACKWNTRCVRAHFLARTRELNALFADSSEEKNDSKDNGDDYGSGRYRRDKDEGYLPRRLR